MPAACSDGRADVVDAGIPLLLAAVLAVVSELRVEDDVRPTVVLVVAGPRVDDGARAPVVPGARLAVVEEPRPLSLIVTWASGSTT